METKQLTCIVCPLGCEMTVTVEGKTVVAVEGNTCPRGKQYATDECTTPVRTLTTFVPIAGSDEMLPVKSVSPVPKESLFACMEALRGVTVTAPVAIGDVVLENIAHTGVDIVATKKVK